jgi:hypothetical protein
MTVLIMFKIMLFYCIKWLNIVLNSLRKMDSCSVMLVGCWWDVTIREYEVDGGWHGMLCEGKGGELTGIIDIDWRNRRRNSGWMYWVMGFTPCLL